MTRFSASDKHKAIVREIEMRKFVYPRRVQSGQISQRQADEQIAIMEEIAADYAKLAEQERLL
jgi:hypothetical protein